MDATTTAALISDYTADISGVLETALPAILVVAAGVFGLVLLVRYAKRFIGGR
jgi:hypothetical protein